ncbi:MAG: hypothetical protein JJT96_07635 [Opitutales bacterium]|nr:hypothetical protein [Opitutales bacterium]
MKIFIVPFTGGQDSELAEQVFLPRLIIDEFIFGLVDWGCRIDDVDFDPLCA